MALLWVLLCSALTVHAVSSQGIVFLGSDSSSADECAKAIANGSLPFDSRPLSDCPSVQLIVASGGEPSVCGYSGGQCHVVCCPKPETITIEPVEPPPNLEPCGTRGTIAGGQDAIRQSWPWMALLGERVGDALRWYCEGVLLNERWVITTAHCSTNHITPDVVRLGEYDHTSDFDGAQPVDYAVEKIFRHPLYQGGLSQHHGYHDVALIRLDKKVIYNPDTFPVCLPWGKESLRNLVDVPATITGWGAKEFGGDHSPILQEGKLDVFESSTCDSQYKGLPTYTTKWPQGITSDTYLCAGGVDSCLGVSGGPLVYQSIENVGPWILGGMVVYGYGCGLKAFPGLYIPVGNPAYLQWIKETAFL